MGRHELHADTRERAGGHYLRVRVHGLLRRMSILPTTIRICDRVYTVTVQPMGDDATGACCNCRQDITVDGDQHPETMASVLLHEVIEAINASMYLELKHDTIMALEVALYGVLVSNEPWWDRHFDDEEVKISE